MTILANITAPSKPNMNQPTRNAMTENNPIIPQSLLLPFLITSFSSFSLLYASLRRCLLIPISGEYPSQVFLKIAGDIRSDYRKDHRKDLHFHVRPGALFPAAGGTLSGSTLPGHQSEKPVQGYSSPDCGSGSSKRMFFNSFTQRAESLGWCLDNRLFQPSIRSGDHCFGHEDVFLGYLPTSFHGSSSPSLSESAYQSYSRRTRRPVHPRSQR